jgi:uncharacterized protein (TIGR02246 family)
MTANFADTATETEVAAVRAVVDGIAESWAANDPDGFADAYTEDASMVLSGDRYFKGREVIRKMTVHQFKAAHQGTTLLQNIVDVQFLSPEAAVVITDGGVLTDGETEPHPARALRATWVMAKNGEGWKIAAYQNGRLADQPLQGE